MTDVRTIFDGANTLGEGPLWDVEEQRFYWIDSMNGLIFRATAEGKELEKWKLPSNIGSMAIRARGGALLALESGLHFFDFKTGKAEPIAHPE